MAPRWLVPVLTAACAALLVASSTVAVARSGRHTHRASVRASAGTTTSSPSSTSTTGAVAPGGVDAVVAQLEAFVAKERGLPFVHPVGVTLLPDAAFRARLAADSPSNQADVSKAEKVLRALRLLAKGVDLAKTEQSLLGGAVAGFYDPKKKDLVVRGGDSTSPYVREVLAHELTHADQDQHFGIDRPDLDKLNDEQSQAFSALIEGDAVRIQHAYLASLPSSERRKANAEELSLGGNIGSPPPVLIDTLEFPYTFGEPFVDAVVKAGGEARLDAAFVHPPTTSEQILHPQLFLAGQGALPIDPPPADGPVIDRGVVGEFGLLLLFLDSTQPLSQAEAARAVQGWGGDHYVAWDQGSQTCVRARFVMDTPTDTDQLVSALHHWAANQPGVTVDGTGPVTLTSCG
jgi:hypothetical protein